MSDWRTAIRKYFINGDLHQIEGTVISRSEGYRSSNSRKGKWIYHELVIKNKDGSEVVIRELTVESTLSPAVEVGTEGEFLFYCLENASIFVAFKNSFTDLDIGGQNLTSAKNLMLLNVFGPLLVVIILSLVFEYNFVFALITYFFSFFALGKMGFTGSMNYLYISTLLRLARKRGFKTTKPKEKINLVKPDGTKLLNL